MAKKATRKRKTKRKRISGVESARKQVTAAKKALKAGHKGAAGRLDKAINRLANAKAKQMCGR